jgi:hypothetical protein
MTNIIPIRMINTNELDHEILMNSAQSWMNHYNFLLSLSIWDDQQRRAFQGEFNFNKVYDV